eukprot:TRINITY_DN266_c4_g1_i1.p1 TRINITY_DN266_c4_g1~~TRINITY_DN266_c4_g1_i1.p1  ORF type:complete len:606 (-),score=107.96 TRINITY_DN266_c4_g1_i1:77-1894(-)
MLRTEHLSMILLLLCFFTVVQSIQWSNLTATELSKVPAVEFWNITASDLASIPIDSSSGFQKDQIAEIPPSSLGTWTDQRFLKINPVACAGFDAKQIPSIPSDAFQGLWNRNASQQCIGSMKSECFGVLNRDQVLNLPGEAFFVIPLSTLQLDTISAITREQMTYEQQCNITSATFLALSLDAFRGLSSSCMATLPTTQMSNFNRQTISVVPSTCFIRVSKEQMISILPDAIAGITISQLNYLSVDACSVMTVSQIVAFNSTTFQGLTLQCLAAITPTTFAKISIDGIRSIPDDTFRGLTAAQLVALPSALLHSLSLSQLASFPASTIGVFTSSQIVELVQRMGQGFINLYGADQWKDLPSNVILDFKTRIFHSIFPSGPVYDNPVTTWLILSMLDPLIDLNTWFVQISSSPSDWSAIRGIRPDQMLYIQPSSLRFLTLNAGKYFFPDTVAVMTGPQLVELGRGVGQMPAESQLAWQPTAIPYLTPIQIQSVTNPVLFSQMSCQQANAFTQDQQGAMSEAQKGDLLLALNLCSGDQSSPIKKWQINNMIWSGIIVGIALFGIMFLGALGTLIFLRVKKYRKERMRQVDEVLEIESSPLVAMRVKR